ncbi:hypothetical protein FKN04_22345 [Bacillus glycinifermentans]|uniref:phage tail spike protein n=1 Tax=Bacillus glycinifermentans TaxID=1664069 RepID=UPI001583A9A9|nr:phage tail spike protein [Bacillus glycinifermentans]NUJ19276.1 hypothetical protein [Bacillus glycinifermentans]
MADLWIFDKEDTLLAVLSSEAEDACVFWNATFREELNQGSTFQFTCDRTHEDSQHVAKLNQVVFKDKDGFFRLFKIREVDRENGGDGATKTAHCEPAEMELLEWIIDDVRPYNTTQQDALNRALAGTRWTGKVSVDLGINSTNFYHISAYEAINEIIKVWGGELMFTVTFDTKTNKIMERVVNIVQRRGQDTGDRFEVGYNVESIQETEMAYPVSALWGWGGSIEDENGNNSRYIDFADVVWSVANGDPVDKPKGQKWVEYPPAKEKYGLKKPDGTRINVFGKWQDENITDPAELLQKTYEQLVNSATKTQTNYSLEVNLLDEPVSLGDTRLALDRTVPDTIEFFGRIIALEYQIEDPEFPAKVEMGQFLSVYEPDDRLDKIEEQLQNIDRNITITDGNLPDQKPPTPQNVQVKGLFSKAYLSWTYDPSLYIAKYEVYGSQTKGFTPSSSTLLWSGKMGGFVHEANVNQVWYYRIRAVNTHGTPSDYTAEFSAATTRIGTNHIEDQSITNAKIKDLSADKITAGTINGITIRGSLIQGARLEPISPSTQYESYIEANTIYQKRNFDLGGSKYYQYESLSISAGKIVQEAGTQNYPTPENNIVKNRTTIEYGKITLDGGQEFSTADVSKMQMYAQNSNSASGYDALSAIEINTNNKLTMSLKHGFQSSTYTKTTWDNPESDLLVTVGKKMSYTVGGDINIAGGGQFELKNPGRFSIDAGAQIYIGSGSFINLDGAVKLPSNFKMRGGGATDDASQGNYTGMGISTSYAISTSDFPTNCLVYLDTIDIFISAGAEGYGSEQYTFEDRFSGKARKIYTVLTQPQGPYSNACAAGVENITNTGFKVYCRGTGSTTGVGNRTMKVFLCIFYTAAK